MNKSDPSPDRHPSEKLDPDQDSDTCQSDKDLQHWFHETNTLSSPVNDKIIRLASTIRINSLSFGNPF